MSSHIMSHWNEFVSFVYLWHRKAFSLELQVYQVASWHRKWALRHFCQTILPFFSQTFEHRERFTKEPKEPKGFEPRFLCQSSLVSEQPCSVMATRWLFWPIRPLFLTKTVSHTLIILCCTLYIVWYTWSYIYIYHHTSVCLTRLALCSADGLFLTRLSPKTWQGVTSEHLPPASSFCFSAPCLKTSFKLFQCLNVRCLRCFCCAFEGTSYISAS